MYLSISFGSTSHYDNGEISFDYPDNWNIKTGSNPSQMVLFQPSANSNITINKQVIPSGYKSPENYVSNSTTARNSGFKLISNNKKKLNHEDAYENTYSINSDEGTYLRKEVWITKNGNLYSIIYNRQVSSNIFDKLDFEPILTTDPGFDTVVKNFNVK